MIVVLVIDMTIHWIELRQKNHSKHMCGTLKCNNLKSIKNIVTTLKRFLKLVYIESIRE